jgi:hypothetical protein
MTRANVTWFRRLVGVLGLLGAAACGAGGTASAPPSRNAPSSASADAQRLLDRVFDGYLAADPSRGRGAGMHAYDGVVQDCSAAALSQRVAAARRDKGELAKLDRHGLSPDETLDLDLLLWALDEELLDLDVRAMPRSEPAFYSGLFEVAPYLDNDGAPPERRTERVTRHEEAALRQIPHVYENLKPPLSKPVAEVAAGIYAGFAESLRGDVATRGRAGATTAPARERFERANASLAAEAEKLSVWLRRDVVPRGDDSHVLGRARFEKLVAVYAGGAKMPLDRFKDLGQADLDRNKRAYDALASSVAPKRPSEAEYLKAASQMLDGARAFIEERHIVTIPTKERATVRESPPYMRYNQAWMESYGPFDDERHTSFFDITLPDPSWPPAERDGYIASFGVLRATLVHEVYPGHFVQGRWIDRAPTRIQKTIGSFTFSEGWAHYAEQMMVDAGFGADDPEARLGQLKDALLRDCRYMVAIGIHTEGMTLAQAEQRFMSDCAQERATAHEQALRATFHPWYFAYTLGKLQILDLRARAERKLGPRFSLQRFHDALLAHGTPPVGLIEDRVLTELGAN